MAKAKKIIRKTEREALKERRKSGQLKQDKQEARAAGLSRGEARKRAKRLSRVQALSKRKVMRAEMAAEKRADKMKFDLAADARRMKARRGGQRLAYDVASKGRYQGTPSEVMQGIRRTSGSFGSQEGKRIMENNERAMLNRKNKANAKVGEMFEIIDSKGKKQKVMKKKAMYGSKVKAVKKAPGGASMKKMPEYEKGGALKSVPSDAKGLSKLPKSVRNKMGYMKNGGKITDPPTKKKAIKKKVIVSPKTNDKTGNKNYRSDAVSSYLKGLDKNSKEYKDTIAYMKKMGIGQ